MIEYTFLETTNTLLTVRGISPVISEVLLVAISVAGVFALYQWATSTLVTSHSSASPTVVQVPHTIASAFCSCVPDLVAYYGFQNISGKLARSSAVVCGGPDVNATLEDTNTSNADADTPPQLVHGSYEDGLKFDGVDDAVVVDYEFNFPHYPFAVLAHIYPFFTISSPPAEVPIVFESYASYRLYIAGSNLVFMIHAADGNYYSVTLAIPSDSLQTPSWHAVLGYADTNKLCARGLRRGGCL